MRRLRLILSWILGTVFALVALAVVLFLLPGVRTSILQNAVEQARRQLPGTLEVDRAWWPRPGQIALEGFRWRDDSGALLASGSASASVYLTPLWRRTLHSEWIRLDSLRADVPRIRAAMAKPDPVNASDPRTLVLRLHLEDIAITAGLVQLDSLHTLDHAVVNGTFVLSDLESARTSVTKLDARGDAGQWSMESAGLDVDVAARRVTGSARASWTGEPAVEANLQATDPHTLSWSARVISSTGPLADASGSLRLPDGERKIHFDAKGSADPALQLPALKNMPRLAERMRGAGFELSGHVIAETKWTGSAQIVVDVPQGQCHARADFDATGAVVDSLTLQLPGLHATGHGRLDDRVVTATLDLTTDDPEWLSWFAESEGWIDRWQLGLHVDASGPLESMAVDGKLEGWLSRPGLEAKQLVVVAHRAASAAAPWELRASGLAQDLGVALRANLQTTPELRVDFAPLRIARGALPAIPELPVGSAHASDQEWVFQDIHLESEFGRARVEGHWGPQLAEIRATFDTVDLDQLPWTLPAALQSREPASGSLQATLEPAAKRLHDATLDLSGTPWIDRGSVRVSGPFDRLELAGLEWSGLGVDLDASGHLDPAALDLRFTLDADTTLTDWLAPGQFDSLQVHASGTVAGLAQMPRIDAMIRAHGDRGKVQVDSVAAHVVGSKDRIDAEVHGWASGIGPLDPVAFDFTVQVDSVANSPRGQATLHFANRQIGWRQRAAFSRADAWVIDSDSLALRVRDRSWANTRPFQITAYPDSVQITDLDLSGSLGTLRADGTWSPQRIDLDAGGELSVPWEGPDLRVGWSARTRGDSLLTKVVALQGDQTRMDADFVIPATRVDALESASVTGTLDCLPIPLGKAWIEPVEHWACASGEFSVVRLGSRPDGTAWLEFRMIDLQPLSEYRLRFDAEGGIVGSGEGYRVQAGLSLTGPAGVMMTGSGEVAADSLSAEPIIGARVSADALNLDDLASLLPPDIGMSGRLTAQATVTGPGSDPVLSGFVRGPIGVSSADGNRVSGSLDLTMSGTRAEPAVRGNLLLDRGLLRIPEPPKALLPTEGDALLWKAVPQSAPVATSTRQAVAMPNIDVAISVKIPGGLWVRGRGLETELVGDLDVGQSNGVVQVDGTLDAQRGALILLGRTFAFERGGVVFEGGDPANPTLDLALTTTVEPIRIRVVFTGPAQNPTLKLESEPEVPEGDIVSYLLFGRPMGELDSGQSDLLESRATEIAAGLGISNLEGVVARQLRVDMVRISRREGNSSLMLGKYLSPRILLQYEQGVEAELDTRLNLEYQLFRGFKIDTLFGRESQSGIGLTWERSY